MSNFSAGRTFTFLLPADSLRNDLLLISTVMKVFSTALNKCLCLSYWFWPGPVQHIFNTCSLVNSKRNFISQDVVTGLVLLDFDCSSWECVSKGNLKETFKKLWEKKLERWKKVFFPDWNRFHDSTLLRSKHCQIEIKWKAVRGLDQSAGWAACSGSPVLISSASMFRKTEERGWKWCD